MSFIVSLYQREHWWEIRKADPPVWAFIIDQEQNKYMKALKSMQYAS